MSENYDYLKIKAFELDNRTYISPGFEFYYPYKGIYPHVNDYFAISQLDDSKKNDKLYSEIYALLNNPLKVENDFTVIQGFNSKMSDLIDNAYKAIFSNYQIHTARFSNSSIVAFRFVYRFINKYDNEGIMIYKSKEELLKVISFICKYFENNIVIAQTNIFTNSIHFIISNLANDKDLMNNYYYRYYLKNRKYTGKNVLVDKNLEAKMNYINTKLGIR